jgi:hypothetical protein
MQNRPANFAAGINPHLTCLMSPIYSGTLAPAHLADLRKSTLTPDTIREQGIRSVSPSMMQHLLGFNPQKVTSAYLLPFPDPSGGWMDHIRLKIFPTLTGADGHTVKYLQPKGSGVRLYFNLMSLNAVLGGETDLWIVEGEKKSLAVAQLGLATIGLCGVEGWHHGGSQRLLEDFDLIPMGRRQIYLLPDGDILGNDHVLRATKQLGSALEQRGATVQVKFLPDRVEEVAA